MGISMFLAISIVFVALILVVKGVRVIKQSECMVIERLGSYRTTLHNGLNFVIPFVDQARPIYWVLGGVSFPTSRIDLRETVLDIPEQSVITKDNVSISIDALMYIQITDPTKATYEISNLPVAVTQLSQTSLRNVIGEMDLDETLASRDIINTKLKMILDEATDKWGTKVNRVELRNITPPKDIQHAMEKQMQAERERRAKVLEAEGDKQARIARSEGQKLEKINLADGDRESRVREANGEAAAIEKVATAKKMAIQAITDVVGDSKLATQYLVANSYIDAMERFVSKPGDKVYIPYESSTVLSSLGGIKEILGK